MKAAGIVLIGMAAAFAVVFSGPAANAAVKTRTVAYTIDGKPFQGFLAYDDARHGKMPGVVVFPAWTGISDNEREHAERLAKLGYVAFVADTYGKGIHPKPPKEAAAEMMIYMKDRKLYRQHAEAAFAELKKEPMVDPNRISAIGYCFGGMGALELARTGAPLKSVIVFHSVLGTPTPADDRNIKEPVLVLQGADDPNTPPATRDEFAKQMDAAHVDWQMVLYGHTAHCYTDAHAGNDLAHGCAYNPESERRSWAAMRGMLHTTMR